MSAAKRRYAATKNRATQGYEQLYADRHAPNIEAMLWLGRQVKQHPHINTINDRAKSSTRRRGVRITLPKVTI